MARMKSCYSFQLVAFADASGKMSKDYSSRFFVSLVFNCGQDDNAKVKQMIMENVEKLKETLSKILDGKEKEVLEDAGKGITNVDNMLDGDIEESSEDTFLNLEW